MGNDKKMNVLQLAAMLLGMALGSAVSAQVPAFPGAEGYGANVTGGRGGEVIKVTNLNNSGAGSLRDAINASGPRTIVFEVSGTIELDYELSISSGDLTIAGQTAPGDGICVKNYNVVVDADNVIIRFMRFRLGDDREDQEDDALWGRNNSDIIIDHCSMSWSVDEVSSFYDNANFTMQYCILSEALYESIHGKGQHSYGGIWGGQGATFHHNLLAHNSSRNPRFNGSRYSGEPDLEKVDHRNNVIYNWGGNSAYGGEGGSYNLVNNYYKPGPASSNTNRIFEAYEGDDGELGFLYVAGNYFPNSELTTEDNWIGIHGIGSSTKEEIRLDEPFDAPQVTTHSAKEAFEHVLAKAGAILPKRDTVDSRIVYETRTGTAHYGGAYGEGRGIIDSPPDDEGGYPTYETGDVPEDSDGDGMPDVWENDRGLDPNDPADRNDDQNGNGYTNLEDYLNELVEQYTYVLRPVNLTATLDDDDVATLTWEDISDKQDEFIIEKLNDETFEQIGSVDTGVTSFEDPEPVTDTAVYRIKAVNGTNASPYTDTVMTWPAVETNIEQSLASGGTSLEVYPNPFQDKLNMKLHLSESKNVTIDLYNMNGKKISTIASQYLHAGENNINWDVSKQLPGGVYYIMVKTREHTTSHKILKY